MLNVRSTPSYRCFHHPTLLRRLDSFWSQPLSNPLSVNQTSFLAAYAACLCDALHQSSPDDLVTLGLQPQQRDVLAEQMNELVGECLRKGDWVQHHRVEFLQAFM